MNFANKIKDSMWWWLGKKNPFVINGEYKLELLFIDKINNSAKIKITNLKNNTETIAVTCQENNDDGR